MPSPKEKSWLPIYDPSVLDSVADRILNKPIIIRIPTSENNGPDGPAIYHVGKLLSIRSDGSGWRLTLNGGEPREIFVTTGTDSITLLSSVALIP